MTLYFWDMKKTFDQIKQNKFNQRGDTKIKQNTSELKGKTKSVYQEVYK